MLFVLVVIIMVLMYLIIKNIARDTEVTDGVYCPGCGRNRGVHTYNGIVVHCPACGYNHMDFY